jgi:hypothetical protein
MLEGAQIIAEPTGVARVLFEIVGEHGPEPRRVFQQVHFRATKLAYPHLVSYRFAMQPRRQHQPVFARAGINVARPRLDPVWQWSNLRFVIASQRVAAAI